jgi:hypothetical protein
MLGVRNPNSRAAGRNMWVTEAIGDYFQNGVHASWHWVRTLNHQEWFLLLGGASVAGFLCMRGFGSRRNT